MSEKVALVTGASRGIGRAIAQLLGQQGLTIIGTATTDAGADRISDNLTAVGINGRGMVLNVTDNESVNLLIKQVNEQYSPPVILVNNAGITKDNILMRMKPEEWFDVIDTNLNALYRLTKACLRGMTKARWGRIITIGSVVGSMGNIGQSNYAATKAGVEGFSKALARELGSRHITVNCVAPGFIDTDMTEKLSADHKRELLAQVPLGRLGTPEEIAGVVAFLASEQGAYITGETIHVNGGMHMA